MTEELEALRRQGRARVMGVLAVLLAVGLAVWLINREPAAGPTTDCGDLDTRAAEAASLPADGFCTVKATVETPMVLIMGRENEAAMDEATRKAGLRYFVKLPGNVVAALPGGRPDVESFKRTTEHLQGFRVEGVGRMFDPDAAKGYGGTAAALRRAFALPDGPFRVFDAADRPPE